MEGISEGEVKLPNASPGRLKATGVYLRGHVG
jgi:hypothetical protein